jgi:tetratricopeptide (TPR) repeat protein
MSELETRQPVGVYPLPAGLMLLPRAVNGEAALAALLRGELPGEYPQLWQPWRLALAGRREEALRLLGKEDALSRYNRFVLTGEPALYAELRGESDVTLRQMAAVVAYTIGLEEDAPGSEGCEGEIAAAIHMSRAAACLEREEQEAARRELEAGIAQARTRSPLLAAQLLDQKAQVEQELGQRAQALSDWQEALRLAGETPLPGLVAHLHLAAGSALHEASQGQRGALELAVQHYQSAIRAGYSLEENPEMYAWTQQQLALAYLAMPLRAATDQLRMGIAVQSLREALKVYTRETHPELWTTTQLNLANALQYLPSAHTKENLIQAVEIYEELIPLRNRAMDPVGYARLLFNQANALAHLGIFQPALEKLNESHKLLHWHGEALLAAQALEQVARINEMMGSEVTA